MSIAEDVLESAFRIEEENEHVQDTAAQKNKMRIEVNEQRPLIIENVIEEIYSREDSMVLLLSDLLKDTISKCIKSTFEDKQTLEFLMNATKMMAAAFNSCQEMTELQRWNQVKKIKKCGNHVIGMELHYKVIITDEKFGMFQRIAGLRRKGELWADDTVVILGYKFIKHALDIDPAKLPDDDAVKALTF